MNKIFGTHNFDCARIDKVEKIGKGHQPPLMYRASHQIMVKDTPARLPSALAELQFCSNFSVLCLFVFAQSAQHVKPFRCRDVYGHMYTPLPGELPGF